MNVNIAGTASSQFGQISVSGTATLAGTLNVSFVNGFTPVAGQSFQIITFGSETGTFSQIIAEGLPLGLTLNPEYDPTDFTLTIS